MTEMCTGYPVQPCNENGCDEPAATTVKYLMAFADYCHEHAAVHRAAIKELRKR